MLRQCPAVRICSKDYPGPRGGFGAHHASEGWADLHGVHGDVDAAVQESLVDLLGEETLAADVSQGLPKDLVSRGLDDHDIQRAILLQLRVRCLQGRRLQARSHPHQEAQSQHGSGRLLQEGGDVWRSGGQMTQFG